MGGVALGHQVTSSVAWLKTNIPKLIEVDRKTTTKQLKSIIRLHHGVEVPDKQITRARQELLAATVEAMNSDYKKIPAYLRRLVEVNPPTESGETIVDVQYQQGHLHRVFVHPGVGAQGNALPFMALDGTYARNCFHSTLLTATFRDNNGGIFLHSWAIVESENSSSWRWFLMLLRRACPHLDQTGSERLTIISDRDKGCRAADDLFPWAARATCAWHLQKNMENKKKKKECGWAVKWLARAVDDAQVIRQERKILEHGGQVSTANFPILPLLNPSKTS